MAKYFGCNSAGSIRGREANLLTRRSLNPVFQNQYSNFAQARRKRLADEEAERVKQDQLEEELRVQERLRTLQRAAALIRDNTERMKLVRSAKLESEVTDTLERQRVR